MDVIGVRVRVGPCIDEDCDAALEVPSLRCMFLEPLAGSRAGNCQSHLPAAISHAFWSHRRLWRREGVRSRFIAGSAPVAEHVWEVMVQLWVSLQLESQLHVPVKLYKTCGVLVMAPCAAPKVARNIET